MLAAISKLPLDLLDVRHIFPPWFRYAHWLVWLVGVFLILSLVVNLIVKFLRYLAETRETGVGQVRRPRSMSLQQLKTALSIILTECDKTGDYRYGLHRISETLKAYFEIKLRKDIEEMTAEEIRVNITERNDLGNFFTELCLIQYREHTPSNAEFAALYNKTVDLVRQS